MSVALLLEMAASDPDRVGVVSDDQRLTVGELNALADLVDQPLRTDDGRVFDGANVENASYGLGICAERSAIVQMVAAGERDPVALVVVTRGPKIGTPCGACRQTLAEFALDLPIYLAVEGHAAPSELTSLEALLPHAFRSDTLLP